MVQRFYQNSVVLYSTERKGLSTLVKRGANALIIACLLTKLSFYFYNGNIKIDINIHYNLCSIDQSARALLTMWSIFFNFRRRSAGLKFPSKTRCSQWPQPIWQHQCPQSMLWSSARRLRPLRIHCYHCAALYSTNSLPLRSTPSLRSQRSPPLRSPSLTGPVPVAPVPGTVSVDSLAGDQLMKSHSIGRLVASVSGSFVEIERAASPGMQLNDRQQKTVDEIRGSRGALALVGGEASGAVSQRSLYGGVDSRATASVKGSRTHLVQATDEAPTRNGAIGRDSSQYSIGVLSTSRSPSQNRSRASTNCGELEVLILFIFIHIYVFLNKDIQSRS